MYVIVLIYAYILYNNYMIIFIIVFYYYNIHMYYMSYNMCRYYGKDIPYRK